MKKQLITLTHPRPLGHGRRFRFPLWTAVLLVAFGLQARADSNGLLRVSSPVPIPEAGTNGNGQRVSWSSVPGLTYQLQTTNALNPASGSALSWLPLTNVTAAGPVSWADDPGAAAWAARFYRVMALAPTNDVTPPSLSAVQATLPPAPPASPLSSLSVIATDNVGVTGVDFLDGDNVLGSAIYGSANTWSFGWMAGTPGNLFSGRHFLRARARDAAGNVGYSPVLQFDLQSSNQTCLTIGGVTICADSEVQNAGIYSFSNHIRINGIQLSNNGTITATATQISGSGDVIVPGLNTVLSGSFDIDPNTGWLTVRAGTTPSFPVLGIPLNAQATFQPTQLSVNVFSNSLSGAGSLTLQVSNHILGPAVLTGSFRYSPLTATASVTGALAMNNLNGNGTITVNLNDSTFTLTGDTSFASSTGEVYYLSNGVAQLTFASPTTPNVYVAGRLGLPEGLALQVQGNVAATGEVEMVGAGHGPIGGFNFDPIEVTLSRPAGLVAVVTVTFRGKLVNPNFSGYLLTGTVRSNGDLDIAGTGNASFSGFSFDPLNLHFLRNAATTNQVIANVDGTLRLSYVQPVVFNGILRQDGSIDLSGQSGPYTAASFGGVVPLMNAPGLSFEQQAFVGCFQLSGRDITVQTLVGFHFTRSTDATGGNATLGVVATTTSPANPTLTLSGQASTTGACSLAGSLVSQQFNLWGYTVNSLSCGISRSTLGVVTFNITGGTLNYSSLVGSSSQATGTIASDGSGSVGFNFSSCTLGGYTLQNASLVLSQSRAGARTLRLAAGSVVLPGFTTSASVALLGTFSNDGTYSLTGTTSASLTLAGQTVTTLNAGAIVTLAQNGLTISGTVSGGVLNQVALASANATLNVAANGTISLSGCVTVSPLTFGQFQIRSTAADGSFSACFGPGGLTVSQNAVCLLYNGSPLTTPSLPSFTIALDGSFSISVTASMTAGLTLNSYSLPNASFTFAVAGGVAVAQNFSASLSVPGFNPGFSATFSNTVTGSLNSNGTFSLTGTSGAGASATLNGLPVSTLNGGATLSLNQAGLTITGTVSGGVLSQVALASATGNLIVAANGSASLSGCVTVPPLTFGQFQIRSTATDGSFSACFGPGGLTVSQNAVRLLYNGSPLTAPSLPSFTIALDGSFSISVTASMTAGLTLNSYSLPNASFTFAVAGGVAIAQNFSGTLSIPASASGFKSAVAVQPTGSLNSDATFSLMGTLNASQVFGLSLPIHNVAAGAAFLLNQSSLTMTGGFSGGVLNNVPLVSANIIVTIASDGSVTFGGTVTTSALIDNLIYLEPISGPIFTWNLSNAGLTIPGLTAQVRVSGVFSRAVTLPGFTLSANGNFGVSVSMVGNKLNPLVFSVNGYSFKSVGTVNLTVSRNADVLSISSITGALGLPGFSQAITGTIDDLGAVTMDFYGTVTLGGFNATADGHLALRNSSLTASGTLDVSVSGTSLGSAYVVANVAPVTGSYTGSGSVSLNLGGYTTSTFTISVSNTGLAGAPNLNFGNLSVSLPDLSITTGGVSASGSVARDTGWQKFWDVQYTEVGDIYGRLQGNLSLSVSGSGTVSASFGATFGWWVVYYHCDQDCPYCPPYNCGDVYGPANINDAQTSSVSGSISSNGQFCVNENHCNLIGDCQNGFCFNLW